VNFGRVRRVVGHRLRDKTTWVVVVSFVVLLSLFRPQPEESFLPLDPQSAEPDGIKALPLFLRNLGVEVAIGPEVRGDVALVLRDNLTTGQADKIDSFVESGGTLVLADSDSTLAIARPLDNGQRGVRQLAPQCSSPFVAGVGVVSPNATRDYNVLRPGNDDVSCFPSRGGAYMVTSEKGRGTVVQLGSPDLFTNDHLARVDNSVFVANLLAGPRGSTVTILERDDEARIGGDKSLRDFIPGSVEQALWQLVLAGLVLMLWKGRRLGRPVEEAQPVAIPGSALTVAVGSLMQNSGQAEGAARILRKDLRRNIAHLLGMSPDESPEVIAQVTAARTGIDEQRLRAALIDQPVTNGGDLLQLAREVEDVHREVAHAR